jgi:hypothetical protein
MIETIGSDGAAIGLADANMSASAYPLRASKICPSDGWCVVPGE